VIRPLTPQKPQRATVTTETKPHSLRKPDDRRPSQEPRQYPGTALGLMLVLGVLLGLLLAAVISSLVDGGSSGSSSPKPKTSSVIPSQQQEDLQTRQRTDAIAADESPESRDVRILGCGTDANGYASAQVLITNSTSKRSTYYVRVIFTAAGDGRTISDDVASAKRLPPGASAPLQSVQAVDAAPGEQVLCRLGGVSRF
jgi:FlaG/FlaF family flagellin (archaellin)